MLYCGDGKFLSLSNVMAPLSTLSSGSPDELGRCQVAALCSPWCSLPVVSCGCVSRGKASHEGRWVPLLIRTVLAIINRCWQELKLGTNLSRFTVQQGQIQAERKSEWLRAARRIHSLILSGTMSRTLKGPLWGSYVPLVAPEALSGLTLTGLLCSLQSKQ